MRGMNGRLGEERTNVPLFPLYAVLFPGTLLPLHVFEPRYLRMMDRVLGTREEFGVVLIANGREVGGPAMPHEVGTLARIVRMERLEDGTMNLLVQGTQRFRIQEVTFDEPYLQARIETVPEESEESVRAYALAVKVRELWRHYEALMRHVAGIEVAGEPPPENTQELAFFVGAGVKCGLHDKQKLLSTWDITDMLAEEIHVLRRELALLRFMARTQEQENERRMGPTGYISRN